MRKLRKKLKKPKSPWDKERMDREDGLMKMYGIRRKREIWSAESILRSFRRRARELAAKKDKAEEKILLEKLYKMGILNKDAILDDVLGLTLENILDRRLQTFVFKNNLAHTPNQARQLVTHGHVTVDGRKIVYPAFFVTRDLEKKISFYGEFSIKITKPQTSS